MLVAGALSVQLGGCGSEFTGEEEVGAGDTVTASGALVRTDVDRPVTTATTTTKPTVTTKPTTTTNPPVVVFNPTPSGGGATTGATDLDRNFPWSVTITDTGGLTCRGTLIHPLWVLTAAHCMGPYAGTVRFTRTDATTGAVLTDSRRFNEFGPNRGMFKHPGYVADSGFGQPKNDIALVRLKEAFAINDGIQTAALPRFYTNAGHVGTIATGNHGNAPSGYTSIVRSPILSSCASPDGFVCISPPAGSLCHGDSGSGFVELVGGRATVTGVTSNIDGGSGDCIEANKQAQLVDVFAYRDWIYSTMGMSPEQVDGRTRVRWSGLAAAPGTMQLECLSNPAMATVSAPMNIPGSEISTECDRVRVWCLSLGTNRNMSSFTMKTFASNGALTATQSLSLLPTFTTALGEPASSFLRFDCGVYDPTSPAAPIGGGGVLSAAF
jgi:hypothetical protein